MNLRIISSAFLALSLASFSWASDISQENRDAKEKSDARLKAAIMSQNIPLEKRVKALKELYHDRTVNGRIQRHFCIWDPLGKLGPIASTVQDQTVRSVHYGLDASIAIFNNEQELIENFKKEKTCDAILVRGALAREFNKFAGTIEAIGALPERKHLQLLMQVFTNPRLNRYMTDGEYTVMGFATIGGNYAFMRDRAYNSLSALEGKQVAVQAIEAPMKALVNQYGGTPIEGGMMRNVLAYTDERVSSMISTAIAYLVMGSGQSGDSTGVLRNPLSQSTMQLIGRAEQFPDELAQLLREDFLLKFNNYAGRVDTEMNLVPDEFWIETPLEETEKLEDIAREVRLAMRDRGFYDATMLRITRKIRCRFNPDKAECLDPVE